MKTAFRRTLLAALLLAALPAAQAAVQNYNFNGMLDSGAFSGQSYSGSFSFDDAALTGTADEWIPVSSLSLNFLGNPYTQANATVGSTPEVSFYDGAFLGLSYSAGVDGNGFSFIPGYTSQVEAFVAYDTPAGLSGTGNVSYNLAPVPEPETYAMFLAGLGLLAGWRRVAGRRS